MIITRTVFILGAGTSIPLGFPSGGDLKKLIVNVDAPTKQQIYECGRTERDLNNFIAAFRESGQPSIDSFLESRLDHLEMGRLAIAAALIRFEAANKLFDATTNGEYLYNLLFQRLWTPKSDEFAKNQVAFITFNYDRSLEQYFFTALKNSYNLPDERIAAMLTNIPIIHVHGQMGRLPWQAGNSAVREYDNVIRPKQVIDAASGIKIVHEANGESAEFAFARRQFEGARRIYFLGFGYHAPNMNRLRVGDVDPQQRQTYIAGSFFCYPEAEAAHLAKLGPGRHVKRGAPGHNSELFLRNDDHFWAE